MIVSLITKTKFRSITLPQKVRGQYVVRAEEDGEMIEVSIEAIDNQWYLMSGKKHVLLDNEKQEAEKLPVVPMALYHGFTRNKKHKFQILQEPITDDRIEFRKFLVRENTKIAIGRRAGNDIIINNTYISGRHFELTYQNGSWMLADYSANGTYVNGYQMEKGVLNYGDVINVMGVIFILGKQYLAVNNPDRSVQANPAVLIPYVRQQYTNREEFEPVNTDYFYLSPRFKRDIEPYKLKFDTPPKDQIGDEVPIMMSVGPAMTMGMASLASGIYGVINGSVMSAVTSGSMLLGTVLWPILSRSYEKKRKHQKEKIRLEKYRLYLEKLRTEILEVSEKQREIRCENIVTTDVCALRITQRTRNLWERSSGQNDFLTLRTGIGTVPLLEEVQLPERKFEIEDDILEEELYALAQKPRVIDKVPVAVSLFEHYITGVIGNREAVLEFANGLILQIASLYSYDEVKLVFIADEEEDFSGVRWLPHVWNNEQSIRFYARTKAEVKEISSYLEGEFKLRGEMKEAELERVKPYYIIFALSRELALRCDIISQVCSEGENRHFSLVCFYDELQNLPKECSNILEISDRNEGRLYNRNDISGGVARFNPDIFVSAGRITELCLKLANIPLDISQNGYVLPKVMTFLEMFRVGKIEHLNSLGRWKENDPTKSLAAQVGVDTLGDPFMLDLHQNYDGPHGLVAGMTGSGKSEFIMTYILSLAINYSPNEVALILIDYKGGGMAKAFEHLPHTAGIITNLDGSAVNRSLISIQSELRRRQKIFAEAGEANGTSNIDIYKYQRMYREGTVKEPLQHLFIISDEFAELKTQQPEFMTQLVSAARIGRSLGVHLILATQKPSGVVDDQIWSNTRFRVCLKVQDKSDSMDMLKRPEAAELQDTGRFYLQVGYNELFKMGQSAWSGAPYYPSDRVEENKDDGIEVVDHVGRVLCAMKLDKNSAKFGKPKKQVDEITEYLKKIAEEEHIKIRSLWLDPIPELIYVDDLKKKYGWQKTVELNPVIGEYDDPAEQAQGLLTIPFTKEGNAVVYGMAGSGKTTFLTTMTWSLITNYTPEEVNIYLLDFAAETLGAFAQAPHVGDVVLAYETEKVNNLFKLLQGQVQTRKKKFAEYGGDMALYNEQAKEKIPYIVVAINNYAAFTEIYEDLAAVMLGLTREGTKYGIYFVLTGTGTGAVGFRLVQNFKQIFVQQLTDDTEYGGIIGKTEGLIPSRFKGRGLVKLENVHEFQTAQPFESENMFQEIRRRCHELKQTTKHRARKIPVLPAVVDLNFIESYVDEDSFRLPVGVETASLEASYFDFAKNYVTTIQSQNNEYAGFTNMFAQMLQKKTGFRTVIIDPEGMLPDVKGAAVTRQEVFETVEELFNELLYRHNNWKETQERGESAPVYEPLVILIAGLSGLRSLLDEEHEERLNLLFEKGQPLFRISLIAADSSRGVSTYTYERWFKANSAPGDAIWIGSGLSDQYNIKTNRTTNDMMGEISENYGFTVVNGKATKIKVLHEEMAEE